MSDLREIGRKILDAQNILILTHINPDGDALGSLTGVGRWLQNEGKTFTMAVDGGMVRRFEYLPLSGEVRERSADNYDVLIALDCGDAERMGEAYSSLKQRPFVINIDHHKTNTFFGDINWVDAEAASTAEMLYFLLTENEVTLDESIANSLLTGIITDTQSFSTSNTTPKSLKAAQGLVDAGGDLSEMTRISLNMRPLSAVRLWGVGLSNMIVEDEIAWVKITLRDKQRAGFKGSGSAGLVNQLVNIQEAQMGAVLLERDDGRVSVSMRSRLPYYVSDVALSLGGGGHAQASGCLLDMPLEKAELVVVDALKYALLDQRDALKAF